MSTLAARRRWQGVRRGLFLAVVAAFILLPLVIVVIQSFGTSAAQTWPPEGFTFRWYREAFAQEAFTVGLLYSIEVAAISTAVSVVIGTMAAYAIARYRFPGRRILQALFVVPLSLPRVVAGFALFVLYASLFPAAYGTVAGIAFAHCLLLLPFVVAIVGAALATMDAALEEAARDLGSSGLRAFRTVTFPQLRIAVLAAAVFAFITSFDEVDTSVFLMPADQTTLPVAMFLYLEQRQDPTVSAMSTVLIALAFLLAVVAMVAVRRIGASSLIGGNGGKRKEAAVE